MHLESRRSMQLSNYAWMFAAGFIVSTSSYIAILCFAIAMKMSGDAPRASCETCLLSQARLGASTRQLTWGTRTGIQKELMFEHLDGEAPKTTHNNWLLMSWFAFMTGKICKKNCKVPYWAFVSSLLSCWHDEDEAFAAFTWGILNKCLFVVSM